MHVLLVVLLLTWKEPTKVIDMTQNIQLLEAPVFHPFKCIRCKGGTGATDRRFFIDLGFDFSEEFNPLNDGNLYLCNLCVTNVVTDINRLVSAWNEANASWDSPDRVASTYEWEKDIDLSGIDAALSRENARSDGSDDLGTETNDSANESDYRSPATADELSVSTVPSTPTDNERSSLDVSRGIGLDFGT